MEDILDTIPRPGRSHVLPGPNENPSDHDCQKPAKASKKCDAGSSFEKDLDPSIQAQLVDSIKFNRSRHRTWDLASPGSEENSAEKMIMERSQFWQPQLKVFDRDGAVLCERNDLPFSENITVQSDRNGLLFNASSHNSSGPITLGASHPNENDSVDSEDSDVEKEGSFNSKLTPDISGNTSTIKRLEEDVHPEAPADESGFENSPQNIAEQSEQSEDDVTLSKDNMEKKKDKGNCSSIVKSTEASLPNENDSKNSERSEIEKEERNVFGRPNGYFEKECKNNASPAIDTIIKLILFLYNAIVWYGVTGFIKKKCFGGIVLIVLFSTCSRLVSGLEDCSGCIVQDRCKKLNSSWQELGQCGTFKCIDKGSGPNIVNVADPIDIQVDGSVKVGSKTTLMCQKIPNTTVWWEGGPKNIDLAFNCIQKAYQDEIEVDCKDPVWHKLILKRTPWEFAQANYTCHINTFCKTMELSKKITSDEESTSTKGHNLDVLFVSLGGIAFVAVIGVIVVIFVKRKKKNKDDPDLEIDRQEPVPTSSNTCNESNEDQEDML